MKSVNLIFDGNYLFHKTRFVVQGFGKNNEVFLDSEEEQARFIRKVTTDFISVLNFFEGYTNIIFTKDSSSWRKNYYSEYKGNRTKGADLNWQNFYKCMDEFMEILKNNGVIISNIDSAEGDDLMYFWSDYYMKNELGHSIIVTGDKDLTQLVGYNDNCYTVVYNNNSKNRKLIVPQNFKQWLIDNQKPLDIFDTNSMYRAVGLDGMVMIKKLLDKVDVEEIDPKKVAFYKIFGGDSGDNVPSIWEWTGKTGKSVRVTKRYIEPLYEYIIDKYDEVDIHKMLEVKIYRNNIRKKLCDIIHRQIHPADFLKNLERNIFLVYLDDTIIPNDIKEKFLTKMEKMNKKPLKKFDRIELLEGTKFQKDDSSRTSDIFNILDR